MSEVLHPGEFLLEKMLKPLGMSASELARGCHMPRSRLSDLITGKRGITADTAVRLGAFFHMAPEDWMAKQAEWELAQVQRDARIERYRRRGWIFGPKGATQLPPPRIKPAPRITHLDVSQLLAAEPLPPEYGNYEHVAVTYPDGTQAIVAQRKKEDET